MIIDSLIKYPRKYSQEKSCSRTCQGFCTLTETQLTMTRNLGVVCLSYNFLLMNRTAIDIRGKKKQACKNKHNPDIIQLHFKRKERLLTNGNFTFQRHLMIRDPSLLFSLNNLPS